MTRRGFPLLALLALSASPFAFAQDGYTDTPFLPGNKWRVHDKFRPRPPAVAPRYDGKPVSPPKGALVLFDGTNTNHWTQPWKIEDGAMVVTPKTGSNTTKESFGSFQLHLEFATPDPPKGMGQGRGNSGVIIAGRYEIQVLDSYETETYADGQCAALYGQYPPMVNASRKPGEWQSYDITFTAPRFGPAPVKKSPDFFTRLWHGLIGKKAAPTPPPAKPGEQVLLSPARVTVVHNGVVVHKNRAILWPVAHKNTNKYSPHGPAPLQLQDHGNPVRYRNIWIRPLDR